MINWPAEPLLGMAQCLSTCNMLILVEDSSALRVQAAPMGVVSVRGIPGHAAKAAIPVRPPAGGEGGVNPRVSPDVGLYYQSREDAEQCAHQDAGVVLGCDMPKALATAHDSALKR
jgi:hypothetical protein